MARRFSGAHTAYESGTLGYISQTINMGTKFMLWTIWFCFVARAGFYCAAVPLWEGYDEYAHFALIQYVATHAGQFPLGPIPPNISLTISESRRLTPAAWIIHDARSGILSYEEYFSLPLAEQNERRARLDKLRRERSPELTHVPETLYEAQQPPLYYWILAPFYHLMEGCSIPSLVLLLRFLTVLIASAAVPVGFFAARRAFQNDAMALGVALVMASFPEMFIVIGHVSNEGLSVAMGALFVLLALVMADGMSSLGSSLLFGVALGAALLTKAYFLALIPLAAVVLYYATCGIAGSRSRPALKIAAVLCLSTAISGWWYVHNVVVTGTLTGQFEDARAMASSNLSLIRAAGQIDWLRVFDLMILSHIWLGDWSFLVVRTWMYRVVELIMFVAILGVCTQVVRERSRLPKRKELVLLVLPYLGMVAGLCFHAIEVFRARGSAATVGYYLYALAVPESILLVSGIARMIPAKLRLLTIPFVVIVLIALEQFGAWFVLFPYYAGLIRHSVNGGLPTAHIEQIWERRNSFFNHLSEVGPVSSPAMLAAIAILYVLATAALLWLACRIAAPEVGLKSGTTTNNQS